MPKRLEQRLQQEARRKHLTGARRNAYVYGTLRRLGWKPKQKATHRTQRGRRGKRR